MQHVFVYLFRQLSYVKERCDSEPEGDGVAVLTSEERTRWAKVGALMFGGFKKKKIVNIVCEEGIMLLWRIS